ncbi:MAG TPA: SRPBCC family protein [Gemmatimonadales bacterium]|nr:SRPBCC family protein [Gemmatimonadales bacterium]
MHTIDRITIRAPLDRVFGLARDVERWPEILPHYRWVRVLDRRADGGRVEMAAWRPFGPALLRYPTWWVSEMWVEPEGEQPVIRYRHIDGITTGLDVRWQLTTAVGGGVAVEIEHQWSGPGWPLVGRVAANLVIGPVFVHGIAARTLAGIRATAEAA